MNQVIMSEPDVMLGETFFELGRDVRTVTTDVPCTFDGFGVNCYVPERYEKTAHEAYAIYGYLDGEERVHGEVTGVTPATVQGTPRLRVRTEPYGAVTPMTKEAILTDD
jgi:hypothetical protein